MIISHSLAFLFSQALLNCSALPWPLPMLSCLLAFPHVSTLSHAPLLSFHLGFLGTGYTPLCSPRASWTVVCIALLKVKKVCSSQSRMSFRAETPFGLPCLRNASKRLTSLLPFFIEHQTHHLAHNRCSVNIGCPVNGCTSKCRFVMFMSCRPSAAQNCGKWDKFCLQIFTGCWIYLE